jgi:nucleoside-diphosphate-sugar epimerase
VAIKLLVLGGSYFAGRIFAMRARKDPGYEITVLNRGRFALGFSNVEELRCDRRDIDGMKKLLRGRSFDAVVDFCAYEPGDISLVFSALNQGIGRYVFLSTASVYEISPYFPKTESSPLVEAERADPASRYVWKKLGLELELERACNKNGASFTILRPSFIYGPFNYIPREAFYFERIAKDMGIHVPEPCLALFQVVYVEDVAEAVILCLGNEKAAGGVYNLAAPEILGYPSYMETLRQISDKPFRTVSIPVEKVHTLKIPLPFPLESHELCSGLKIERELGLAYTPFMAGMKTSYEASKHIWEESPSG